MKIFLVIFSLLTTSLALWGYLYYSQSSFAENKILNQTLPNDSGWSKQENESIAAGEQREVQSRIQIIRKRLALKWLILEGDSYYNSGDLTLALSRYIQFYKQNPNDPLIIKKLWDTYMSMHKYSSAVTYYKKIDGNSSTNLIKGLFLDTDFSNLASIKTLESELIDLNLDEQELLYYSLSASCAVDFHTCKKEFWEYFWPEGEELPVENASTQITFSPLLDIKNAIENYRNFQLDDVSLKDAFIISQWYKQGLYSLVIEISNKDILPLKPEYKAVIKLLAQSYFETWKYEKARETLSRYNEIDDSDTSVIYLQWIISTKLRDYVLANIHFNRAIKLWYENSLAARRNIIHNFFALENTENMLREFRELIRKENYSESDASLAIYNHVLYEDYQWPVSVIKEIQEKFPNNGNFYAYEWWILREQWELEASESSLEMWNKIDEKNPFVLINLAYTYKELWKTWASLISFKRVIDISPESDFGLQASKEIENLKQ